MRWKDKQVKCELQVYNHTSDLTFTTRNWIHLHIFISHQLPGSVSQQHTAVHLHTHTQHVNETFNLFFSCVVNYTSNIWSHIITRSVYISLTSCFYNAVLVCVCLTWLFACGWLR